MDKNREAFEAWWKKPEQAELRSSCSQGWAYYIWNNSIREIEVELPTKLPEEELTNLSYNLGLEHASVAIKYVGIRVREE